MITFFCLGVPNILPLWPVGILGKVCFHVFAKPISDPRESVVLFSGLHFLCPYLEVNRYGSSLGVVRRFVVVDAAFLVTDGELEFAKNTLRRLSMI
jgi:hypothetical protein